ncbi:hypothetical protein ACFZAD_12880 [Streptomyces iakyrus]|uniref:hypothetical protein n=1 Tax=Streptomyces iakyrus TaxID=68219 RepID=UPI0036EDCBFC
MDWLKGTRRLRQWTRGGARTRLVQQGTPAPEADKLSSAVSDSAGAMISGLSENPQTASAADAARDAMSHALQINGYTCAALLALGMPATLLIPRPDRPHNTIHGIERMDVTGPCA